MKPVNASASGQRNDRWLLLPACWAIVVVVFASQWYLYDAAHGLTDRFRLLSRLVFIICGGVLTPLALWLARRYPVEATRSSF
jgi:hypothetical protein